MVTLQSSNLQAGKSLNHNLKKNHEHSYSAVYRVRQLGMGGGGGGGQ